MKNYELYNLKKKFSSEIKIAMNSHDSKFIILKEKCRF